MRRVPLRLKLRRVSNVSEKRPMNNEVIPDRRSSQRHSVRIPLLLRIWESPDPEQMAEPVDLSERGALLETAARLRVGMRVDLQFKLSEEITGQPTTEWRCKARVVHIRPGSSLNSPSRVGVHFEWLYELRR